MAADQFQKVSTGVCIESADVRSAEIYLEESGEYQVGKGYAIH